MAQQTINIGAAPNDGTGTPLRTSFDYTNQNFTELYTAAGIGLSSNTQVIFNDSGVLKGDAGLVYNKTTDALTVTGPVIASSTLAVTGVTTLTGAVSASSTLNVTGNATISAMTVGKGGTSTNTTNTAVGNTASNVLSSGVHTTSIGYQSNLLTTIGSYNTAIGSSTLIANVSGIENTAVGYNSQITATSNYNTSIGSMSGRDSSTSAECTYLGAYSGSLHISGDNCAFIGYGSQGSTTTIANEYTYGNTSVLNHRFANGNVKVESGNLLIGGTTAGASAAKTIQLFNGTAPSATIAGGQLYVEAGALKYIGSSGTPTTLAVA